MVQILPKTVLSETQEISLTVEKEKVQENEKQNMLDKFLAGSLMVFIVNTHEPLNWTVKRNISDFKWLHKALSYLFPSYYVDSFLSIDPCIPIEGETNSRNDGSLSFNFS